MKAALYTKWLYSHEGKTARMKVVGIWGTGSRDTYKVTAYELKQDSKPGVDLVSASKMAAMIKDGRLTYLAPGPEIPDSGFNRESAAFPSPILRPEPNNRRTIGEQKAKERRTKPEPGAVLNITRMEF